MLKPRRRPKRRSFSALDSMHCSSTSASSSLRQDARNSRHAKNSGWRCTTSFLPTRQGEAMTSLRHRLTSSNTSLTNTSTRHCPKTRTDSCLRSTTPETYSLIGGTLNNIGTATCGTSSSSEDDDRDLASDAELSLILTGGQLPRYCLFDN